LSQTIKIPRLKDKVLIDCFKEIAVKLSNHKQTASTSLLGSASFSFDPANPEENEEVSELIKKNSELIFSLSLNVGGFLVRLYRGGTGEPKSPYTDDLQLLPGNDCKLSDNEKIEIGYTVVKKLKAIESGRTVGGKNSKEQEELASIHEATLSRLEELNEKLIFDSHEYRKNLETEHLSKLHALEEAFSTREQELTKNHQRLSEQLQEKEQAFEERKKSLTARATLTQDDKFAKTLLAKLKNVKPNSN